MYNAAMEAVRDCVLNDDRSTWFPKILHTLEDGRQIHDIDGVKASVCPRNNAALTRSLLRLVVDESLPCALFAYPAADGVQAVDVLVGWLDADMALTPACVDGRMYPMLCRRMSYSRLQA